MEKVSEQRLFRKEPVKEVLQIVSRLTQLAERLGNEKVWGIDVDKYQQGGKNLKKYWRVY